MLGLILNKKSVDVDRIAETLLLSSGIILLIYCNTFLLTIFWTLALSIPPLATLISIVVHTVVFLGLAFDPKDSITQTIIYPAKYFLKLWSKLWSNKNFITHSMLKTTTVLLFILSFALPTGFALTTSVLMFWQLISNKEHYSFEEIVLCVLMGSFLPLNFLIIATYILTESPLITSFILLGLSCILPTIAAYNFHNGNINLTNLFCIKTPLPNQLDKVALQFIAYSIPILALLYASGVLSMIYVALAAIPQVTMPLYLTLMFQTYWEEAIFRLFLIKNCVNEDNSIDTYLAVTLSFASSLLFAYAHRYNGAFKAIQKATSFLTASIICFLQYSGTFLVLSISNIAERGNIIPSWVAHYYNNVIAFTFSFYKSEYDRFEEYTPTIAGSLEKSLLEGIFIAGFGNAALSAINLLGFDTEIKYAKNNRPISDDKYGDLNSGSDFGVHPKELI